MYRSVVVEREDKRSGRGGQPSPASAFVEALATDLKRFGRDDVALVTVGEITMFAWQPEVRSRGSGELRAAAMEHRLRSQSAVLAAMEATLPSAFFEPFELDFNRIEPEVTVCATRDDERMFDYLVWGQSIPSDTKNFRNIKVLVYDVGQAERRPLGALLFKSPMYFDGARDRHLGWPDLFETVDGVRQKNHAAFDLRNKALKSIYNVGVCMLAPPYTRGGLGKLIASLCFSSEIVNHLEAKFGQPVLGLTTTGGWGANATQYDNLRLATEADGGKGHLFIRTYGARASLNFPTHLFSRTVLQRAMDVLRADTTVKSREYKDFLTDAMVAKQAFRLACRLVGVPFRATASNAIAHYFGSMSAACTEALRTTAGIDAPPMVRSIPVSDAAAAWRSKFQRLAPITTAKAPRLSEQAT